MVLATVGWVDPLIAGLAGVFGALVGASALVFVTLYTARRDREQHRLDAFVGFYSATNSLGLVWHTWSDIQARPIDRFFMRLPTDKTAEAILSRMWSSTDAFWKASGRARAVASADEVTTIDLMEKVIADWNMGDPVPEQWGPAIREVRKLFEPRR